MDNRRSYVRLTKRLHFYFQHPDGEDVQAALARDISAGGLFLIDDKETAEGTLIELEVDLHNDTRAETVKARVVRCQQFKEGIWGLGVQFEQISETLRANIEAFVAAQSGEQPFDELESYLLHQYMDEVSGRWNDHQEPVDTD